MVRTGTRKMQKRSMCFWISGHHISAMLLTTIFLMFWVLGWLWKIKIRSRKSILVKIFIKNIFFWRLIIFHSCCKILCFTLFPILLKKINFGLFLLYVISFFSLFDYFLSKILPQINPARLHAAILCKFDFPCDWQSRACSEDNFQRSSNVAWL